MAKLKLTVTLSPELIHWIDEQVKQEHFADRSHAVQYSIHKVRELIEKGEIKF
jgi:Arc/MetJ-type ribon-helix-helix transcriptional regulator